jgi:hypothetical protein
MPRIFPYFEDILAHTLDRVKTITVYFQVKGKENGPAGVAAPRDPAHSHQRRNAVDDDILARSGHTVRIDQDHEGSEEHGKRSCFYCLEGWVFLGSVGHDGEEVMEAIRCRRCKGTGWISR